MRLPLLARQSRLLALAPALGCLCLSLLSGCSANTVTVWAYEIAFDDGWTPSASAAVDMAFDKEDADQRRKGITALASKPYGGADEYLAIYRLNAKNDNAGVRAAAALALGRHGKPQDARILAAMLRDDAPMVRWTAADALRKVHNPVAVPALIERLNLDIEDDTDTAACAALALGQYPDPVVFSRLVQALEQPSYNVVTAAHRSLTLITGHDAGLDPRDWGEWSKKATKGIFANKQAYTYQTYQPERGWFDSYITFWDNNDDGLRTPAGLKSDKPAGG